MSSERLVIEMHENSSRGREKTATGRVSFSGCVRNSNKGNGDDDCRSSAMLPGQVSVFDSEAGVQFFR